MILMHLSADEGLLAAIGKISIRHGQLDYSLKMTVRTLANLTIEEALDATDRQGSHELRERVRKLAKNRLGEGEALAKLDAILMRARRVSAMRNDLLHGLWGHELDGKPVMRAGGYEFKDPPSTADLEEMAIEIGKVAWDLTEARLDGFLKNALSN